MKNKKEIITSIEDCAEKEATVKFQLIDGGITTGKVVHIVKDEYIIIKKNSLLVIPTHDVVELSKVSDVNC